ncbi:GH23715 [Drosophila grimshawi]|uniref:Structural maintenance of chromosomes protein 5 n=1 Tax=Drosophila grimshawi TaxID=7222 RepID=B4K0X0_DROGR|nr:GH23715 [Drosophila grimshawi]
MHNSSKLTQAQLVGRIKSVYCKDFVSYSEITFFPKEYLNVLTGPNGTGKSTIVSAIILGLGGEPQLLKRSSSISDYIKSSKSTATVIITVYGRGNNSTEAFKRIISDNGQSRYFVNSKELSKTKFVDIIATYNIQVSNLCQFLPQDRVQDFSKMNPQELLVNTMASVCDNELIRCFNDLKEMRKTQSSAHDDREREKEKLLKEQKRLEQLQISVDQYQERQGIQHKLNVYKAKKLCVEMSVGKTKIDDYNSQLIKEKVDCEAQKKTFESKKRAQEEVMKKSSILEKKTTEQVQLINKSIATKCDLVSQLETIKHKINENKCDLERNIQQSIESISEMEKIKLLLETKQHELQQFSNDKMEVLNELEQQKKTIVTTREITMNQCNKRREFETMLNDEKIPEITALTHKIERLQNMKSQKIEELRQRNPNVVKAMNWVAQNKHKYKCNIYDPMVFELSIKSDEAAMYLENVVRQRDLYAFACEDKIDMSDLINELCVKQKLSVNVIYCGPADRCLFTSRVPITEIMQIGFTSYLVDLISGPIPIINKLCGTYQIHNIPIGKDEVSNFTSRVPKSIRIYFGGTKMFSVTTSRYRPDSILTESTVRRKNQLISLDSTQLTSLKERYSKLIYEKDKIRNNLREIDSEIDRLQIVFREEGEKKRKIEQKLTHYGNLETDVKKLQMKVDNLNKSISSLETVKKTFQRDLLSDLRKILKIESKLINSVETADKFQTKYKLNEAIKSVHKQQHELQINAVKESQEIYRMATSKVEKLTGLLQAQLQEISSKTVEVKRLCNGQLPSSESFPFKSDFEKILSLSLEQILEAIIDFQARLECMKNCDSEVLTNYHQRQANVEQLKKSIENKSIQEKNVEAEILNVFNKWEPQLTQLIETINAKFSEFMDSIEYVGEVVLSRKEAIDFESYGIQIMVQYRKDAKLQTLDKYIQSGGERAVAIAIYSLSLQHVTHVPFRCVDEINQGMDAKNERHIFDLLLKEATKQGSAQYLFVTPKLLRDLSYNQHLCVSVVHNSGSIKPDTYFPLN